MASPSPRAAPVEASTVASGDPRSEPRRVRRTLLLAAASVFALLSALSLLRHHTFHSSLYDLGIFHQVLWNTAHGRPFASSIKHMSYLGDHLSPSFALLAPLEWLPRPLELLLVAQAACVPVTAWLAFRLARRHLPPRASLLLGLGTLLAPPLYCPTLADLHPEPFMAVALGGALLAIDEGRLPRAALLLALVLLGKEDAGLLLGPLGLLLAVTARSDGRLRLFGAALLVVSLCWTALAVLVVMPSLRPPARPGEGWFYLRRFAHLGDSPAAIARTVLLHPLHAVAASTTPRKVVTLLSLVVPFALAPLRSWRVLAMVPFAAAHYLSGRSWEFEFPFHYLVPTVPVLAWAAVEGAPFTAVRRPRAATVAVAAAGLLSVVWRFDPEPLLPRGNHAALAEALRLIPDGEPVCVANHFGAHLAARREIDFCTLWEYERDQYRYYGWPEASLARWQIFDLADGSGEHPGQAARLAELRTQGATVAFERDGVVVLRVGGP